MGILRGRMNGALTMFEYPKINTIWKRDERTHKVLVGEYSRPEFSAIRKWAVTEKIDGTNVRISFRPNELQAIHIAGRTDNAQLHPKLTEHLLSTFTSERLSRISPKQEAILFGEGFGAKIQNGGRYRPAASFILFDVWIDGWWLEFDKVIEISELLGIPHVPFLGVLNAEDAAFLVEMKRTSSIAEDKTLVAEGIVATSHPMMMFRNGGSPIRWKLKVRDIESKSKER